MKLRTLMTLLFFFWTSAYAASNCVGTCYGPVTSFRADQFSGMKGRSGDLLDQLQMRMPYGGGLTYAVGGNGGRAFSTNCRASAGPTGGLVTGIHGRAGDLIDRLGLHCGDWDKTPQYGGNGGSPFSLKCRRGDVVQRMDVYTGIPQDNYIRVISGLRITCGRPYNNHNHYNDNGNDDFNNHGNDFDIF